MSVLQSEVLSDASAVTMGEFFSPISHPAAGVGPLDVEHLYF